jgi:hypothetical protein
LPDLLPRVDLLCAGLLCEALLRTGRAVLRPEALRSGDLLRPGDLLRSGL